jgi:hypothetical protein
MGKGTHVLANWIDISSNNSPTVATSSGFHSPFGCATPVRNCEAMALKT